MSCSSVYRSIGRYDIVAIIFVLDYGIDMLAWSGCANESLWSHVWGDDDGGDDDDDDDDDIEVSSHDRSPEIS